MAGIGSSNRYTNHQKKQKTNHNPSPISITASHTEMSSTDIIHPITIRPKPTNTL